MEDGLRQRAGEPASRTTTIQSPPIQSSSSLDVESLISSLSTEFAAHHTSSVDTASLTTSLSSNSAMATSIPASTSSIVPASTTSVITTSSTPTTATAVVAYTDTSDHIDNRTLTIILSSCLGFLGLVLIVLALLFLRRYRRRLPPFSRFSHRGASPIDDEEIATWRGNTQEMAKTPSTHVRSASSVVYEPTQVWTWASATMKAGDLPGAGAAIPYPPPPVIARAPNARCGLTDDTVPGAAPFVKTSRRHSKRLSKSQSSNHIRSKSRRSSISILSIKERPSLSNGQWTEPDEWNVERKRSSSAPRKSAVGRTSTGDDTRPTGLAPRPQAPVDIPHSQMPGAAL